ncbi:MAG: carbohydrate binding domain-containing protein [Phycisphaeraceae bacterium]
MNWRINTLAGALLMAAGMVVPAQAATVVIDSSTRNGSFETGDTSDWSLINMFGGDDSTATVISDGTAPDGDYHLELYKLGGNAPTIQIYHHNIAFDPSNGDEFTLSFDAAMAEVGYDRIRAELKANGTNQIIQMVPGWAALDTEWANYSGSGTIDNIELVTSLEVKIVVESNSPTSSDVGYTSYLDNLVVTQTPEPATLGLLGLGALLTFGRRANRR